MAGETSLSGQNFLPLSPGVERSRADQHVTARENLLGGAEWLGNPTNGEKSKVGEARQGVYCRVEQYGLSANGHGSRTGQPTDQRGGLCLGAG